MNQQELDLLGVNADAPITIATATNLREFLALMLEPLELTILMRDAGIEVTSRDAADNRPKIEYYDMIWLVDAQVEPTPVTLVDWLTFDSE